MGAFAKSRARTLPTSAAKRNIPASISPDGAG